MSCEHLVCAACAGPVAEGRCATCRAHRADVHHHGPAFSTQALLLAMVALLLVAALWSRAL